LILLELKNPQLDLRAQDIAKLRALFPKPNNIEARVNNKFPHSQIRPLGEKFCFLI